MKSLKYQTKQDMFNNAYKGLRGQGFMRSVKVNESNEVFVTSNCVYRGPNGTKCAIGHCLSDKEYDPDMESTAVKSVFGELGLKVYIKNTTKKTKKMLFADSLQNLHDSSKNPEDMESKLVAFAKEYNLTVPA